MMNALWKLSKSYWSLISISRYPCLLRLSGEMSHCIVPLLERKGLQITILDQLLRLIAVYKRECVCVHACQRMPLSLWPIIADLKTSMRSNGTVSCRWCIAPISHYSLLNVIIMRSVNIKSLAPQKQLEMDNHNMHKSGSYHRPHSAWHILLEAPLIGGLS
jgi:hypothetical protein